ncbi:MAG: GatB/YqeY domain-containing protein [Desulfobacterota bacterium]|nr:GatB/YqeY domain-containing protein [Thermodesulfobacteriota bacterium]
MQTRLRSELHQALKKKDSLRASTIRMMIAELTNKEKEGKPLEEQDVYRVFYGMLRRREEAIAEFNKANRQDLVEKEKAEMEIIKEFLPSPMGEEEIKEEVRQVIAELNARDMKSMGKVMGILTQKLAGRVAGGVLSKIVKEELSK